MSNLREVITALLTVCLIGAFTLPAIADIPDVINYQGFLTDTDGNPVPDGDYAMDFTLWTSVDGETGVWSQTSSAVSIVDGIYNVKLGPFIYPEQIFIGDLYLEIEVNGEVLAPRQQLTSVPYALNARVSDTVVNGAITTVMMADGAVNTDKLVDGAVTAAKVTGGFVPNLDADKLDGFDSASFALSTHNHDSRYYSKSEVDALVSGYESRIAALENKLQYLTVVSGTVNGMAGPHVMITGANLHVRSGSGSTNGSINGRGNLIVGYNELRGSGNVRTGSHNIVVGKEHNYSSFGGLVAGITNDITGEFSSVTGGSVNRADGNESSVTGGRGNEADGLRSAVHGGYGNVAWSWYSAVFGGQGNTAGDDSDGTHEQGKNSTVCGGSANVTEGNHSVVLGGSGNVANMEYAAKTGSRPDYSSGWVNINRWQNITLTHNLGGDPYKYRVQLFAYDTTFGLEQNQVVIGGDSSAGYSFGFWLHSLNDTTATIERGKDDDAAQYVMLRIWKYN